MELKKGYKQTEVGVIPEGWEVVNLAKACRLINGRGFKPHEWRLEGLPIIRIQNLNGSDDYNFFIGSYDKKIEVENGQLLFAWSGSRGTSFGPHVWNGEKGLLNYHTWKVDINEVVTDKGYFLYALKKLTKYIEDKAHGASALVHVQKWEMEKFLFPLPPTKAEQTAIATALSDADALISRLETLIAKKRAIKQGAMQQLLKPKEGWVVKKLGEVLDKIIGGGTPSRSKSHYWNGNIPWVTVKDFATYNSTSTQEYITKDGLMNSASNLIPKGTLITSTRMGLGKAVIYDVDVSVNQDLKALFPKKDIDSKFLYYWFQYNSEFIESLGSGSTVMGISLPDLKKIEFGQPTHKEQTRIAQILSDMDAEIAGLEQKLAKYKLVKQGMMQELLTGKTRLI